MPKLPETRNARRAAVAAVVLATVAAFAATLGYDLVWDDGLLIQQNWRLGQWDELPRLLVSQFWRAAGETSRYYRPLITLTFFLDRKIWGLHPVGFHLTNLLAHVAVVLAVLVVARRVTGDRLAAGVGALAFALHPLHSESVTFVSGRTDVLAALFFLLALLAYDRHRDRPRWYMTACSLGAYLLALLAKEVAITLPVILLLWDWRVRGDLRDRRAAWRGAARCAPYGGVLGLYLGLRLFALRSVGDSAAGAWAPPITRLLTALQTAASYVWMTIVPYPDNPYRVVTPIAAPPDLHWWLSVVGLGAAIGGTAWALWRVPPVGFGALWFWITLVPSAGVNLLPLPTVLMAERFLYLPTVGYCLILGWIASRLLDPSRLGRAAPLRLAPALGLAALFLAYFVLTLWRNEEWRDEDRLYSRMVEASPAAAVPHINLGFVQLSRGEIASASAHLREAVEIEPRNPRAQVGLGLAETLLGHFDTGLRYGLRAGELAPGNADVRGSLGALYLARGEPARAVPELSESLRLRPNQVHVALNLALALAWLDRPEAAEAQLEQALRLVRLMSPDLPLADRITAEVVAGHDPVRAHAAWVRYVARVHASGHMSPAVAAELDRAERRLGKISLTYPDARPRECEQAELESSPDRAPGGPAERCR